MNDDGFEIRTKRWTGAAWTPVGLAFLYLAIDLKFLHQIPGATEESGSWLVFFILMAISLGILYPAIRAILRPRTLLAVDSRGITISAAGSHSEWDEKAGRMETTIRYGQETHIPWSLIERIERGTIERIREQSVGGTTVSRTTSSRTRVGGTTVRHTQTRPALRILCSRKIRMDQISVRGLIDARTGDAPNEITAEDRAYYSPEEIDDLIYSEFLIDVRLLPGPVEQVISVMTNLRTKAT